MVLFSTTCRIRITDSLRQVIVYLFDKLIVLYVILVAKRRKITLDSLFNLSFVSHSIIQNYWIQYILIDQFLTILGNLSPNKS